jgi:Kef-type K+ transport system membrane component KefB
MDLLLSLSLLLLFAKIFGSYTNKLGISSMVGEIVAGILLGPFITLDTSFSIITFFGIMFVLFLSGLSTNFEEIKGNFYFGSIIAIGNCLITATAAYFFGILVFKNHIIAFLMAVAVASTSDAVGLKCLIDLGEFKSNLGKKITAIILSDDVISIAGLAILMMYVTVGNVVMGDVSVLILMTIGFFILALSLGAKIVHYIFLYSKKIFDDEYTLLILTFTIFFVIAFLAEKIGVTAIVGAFIAGAIINKNKKINEVVEPKVKTIGEGFFIPLFFAYIGATLEISGLLTIWPLIIIFSIIMICAKFFSGYLLTMPYGLRKNERMVVGASLIPRGDYTIAIAQLGLSLGIINAEVNELLVFTTLITTLVTPILMKTVKWVI